MSRGYWNADSDLDWYAEVNPETEPEPPEEEAMTDYLDAPMFQPVPVTGWDRLTAEEKQRFQANKRLADAIVQAVMLSLWKDDEP